MCQAVLNTFACYHVDDGNGLYADNQLVRYSCQYYISFCSRARAAFNRGCALDMYTRGRHYDCQQSACSESYEQQL